MAEKFFEIVLPRGMGGEFASFLRAMLIRKAYEEVSPSRFFFVSGRLKKTFGFDLDELLDMTIGSLRFRDDCGRGVLFLREAGNSDIDAAVRAVDFGFGGMRGIHLFDSLLHEARSRMRTYVFLFLAWRRRWR